MAVGGSVLSGRRGLEAHAAGAAQCGGQARVRLLSHLRCEAEQYAENAGICGGTAVGGGERIPDGQKRVRPGPLRSAALAGLVPAHHLVDGGTGRADRTARAGEKNLPPARFLSACRKSGICSLSSGAGAGTARNIYSRGLTGEDGINSSPSSSTTEDRTLCSSLLSYDCSTRACY